MKIKNKLGSLVFISLIGCFFFGTGVEAKKRRRRNAPAPVSGNVVETRSGKGAAVLGTMLKKGMVKGIRSLKDWMNALRATGYKVDRFDLAAYCLYNDWVRFVQMSKMLPKEQLAGINWEAVQALKKYVSREYNGLYYACLLAELYDEIFPVNSHRFVSRQVWRAAVTNAIKRLNGRTRKNPFKNGVKIAKVQDMLSLGINPKKEVVELLVGSAKSTAGRSKFYLKEVGIQHGFSLFRNEFVRLLAQELGVSYEYLRDNVDFLVKLVVLV